MPNVAAFEARLKKHDRYLAVEDLGDHFAIIDTSRPVSYRKVDLGGAVRYLPTFQRVMHLKPGQALDGAVIKEIQARDMRRWDRGKDFIHHMETQVQKAEAEPERKRNDFVEAMAKDSFGHIKGKIGVVVSGNKDGGVYDDSR